MENNYQKSYQRDAVLTVRFIKANFRDKSQFKYNEIVRFFVDNKIAPVVLYNLKLAKLLTQLDRGVYWATSTLYDLTDAQIVERVKIATKSKNKINNQKKRIKAELNSKNLKLDIDAKQISEQEAINFLKSKGYKIMKPVSQYEEV